MNPAECGWVRSDRHSWDFTTKCRLDAPCWRSQAVTLRGSLIRRPARPRRKLDVGATAARHLTIGKVLTFRQSHFGFDQHRDPLRPWRVVAHKPGNSDRGVFPVIETA